MKSNASICIAIARQKFLTFIHSVVFFTSVALLATGCSFIEKNQDAIIGGTVGCIGGYAACVLATGNTTVCIAACVAGGVIGASIGHYFDKRREELEQAAKTANLQLAFTDVAITVQPPPNLTPSDQNPSTPEISKQTSPEEPKKNGLLVEVGVTEMFPSGSAQLTADAQSKISALAKVYAKRAILGKTVETKLLITGHTDSTGTPTTNQKLSENRARQVAGTFAAAGIPTTDLYLKGAGSSQPIADNETELGKAKNRRIEILEIDNETNLINYATARKQDLRSLAYSTENPDKPSKPAKKSAKKSKKAPASQAQEITHSAIAGNKSDTTASEKPDKSLENQIAKKDSSKTEPDRRLQYPDTKQDKYQFFGQQAFTSEKEIAEMIGKQPKKFNWKLPIISDATATENAEIKACYLDQARVDGEVIRYSNDQTVGAHSSITGETIQNYLVGDYLPGMYGTGWGGPVGMSTVGVSPVAILKDSVRPVVNPTIYIQAPSKKSPESFRSIVNTYEGDKGILLRIYIQENGAPISCLDVALPKEGGAKSRTGWVFYRTANLWMQSNFQPELKR